MALSDALNRQKRHNERLLSNLERRYDKDGQAHREYVKALSDINHLLKSGYIDLPYALDLRDAAKENYERIRQAKLDESEKQKVLNNPTPDYVNGVATIGAFLVVLFIVIPLLF